MKYTLGIETSCDETSCAVLRNYRVLANTTLSSLREHKKYGGVVPEIATRAHLKNIDRVLTIACRQSGIALKKINLISVTAHPGLIGALVVGVNFAKALALSLKVPYVGVNHLYAHLFAPFLNCSRRLKFPFLGVVISGGHTAVYRVDDFDRIKVLGRTRDDACGEVFDKVAKAYGLGYPGGPAIDRLYNSSDKQAFAFKCGKIGLDLSFSGVKTAAFYRKKEMEQRGIFSSRIRTKLASSFQFTVLEAVIAVILEAAEKFKINRIVCGGGVVANRYFRQRIKEENRKGKEFFIASREYAGDNAAIVAGLGFYLYNKKGVRSSFNLTARPN